jgi:succinate-semialdehyde dehydrogenase/glutarate-semialdehyde dehydrogenase
MAGNAVLLKHAPNVTGCAIAIEKIFIDSGFPEYLFKSIVVEVNQVKDILENEQISGVSLTGSEQAGISVGELAGKNLKPAVLELGGSDPYIVFEDADLEQAVETCVTSRLINCGQTCISAKRFIVHENIYTEFIEKFTETMKSKTMGDPMASHDLGPMARKDLRDKLHNQVLASVKEGAKLILGGKIPELIGHYYPPTILTDVTPKMTAWQEETFGPVATIISFSTELEAVRLALDTPYGLGAALFSKDIEHMEKLAKYKINAGSVFINDFVKSDPRLPFGGVKASGFGRELSEQGIFEFVNIKTIVVR